MIKVKKIASTLALSFLVAAAAYAQPHHDGKCASSCNKADTLLLSEHTEGNYIVRKYSIRRQCANEYTMHYRISRAQFNDTFDNNANEISALTDFVDRMAKDRDIQIVAATITGYSSPDGPCKFNHALAEKRAADFETFLRGKYQMPSQCRLATHAVAEPWKACIPLVESCPIPNKQAVLEILRSDASEAEKEHKLKHLPDAWNYLKQHILPEMRCVELDIDAVQSDNLTTRARLYETDEITVPLTEKETKQLEKAENQVAETTQEMAQAGQDAADKMSKKEARLAKKLARKEARAARKLAKREERLAKKLAKSTNDVEQMSYRDLERRLE